MSTGSAARAAALVALGMLSAAFTGHAALAQGASGWTELAPLPLPRSDLTGVAVGTHIYVGGGINTDGAVAAFHAFDTKTATWSELPNVPRRRHRAAMTALDGKVLVSGGFMTGTELLDDLRAFDPQTSVWSRLPSMPGRRAAHTMVAARGKVYVIGGIARDPHDVWVYDPATRRWRDDTAGLPTMRENAAAVAVGGRIYVIGGRWSRVNLSVNEAYDTFTNRWIRLTPMPAPVSGLAATVIDGRIHVIGGEDLATGRTTGAHYVYDPRTGEWETMPPLPTARHGGAVVAVDRALYVIGGATRAGAETYNSLTGVVESFRLE